MKKFIIVMAVLLLSIGANAQDIVYRGQFNVECGVTDLHWFNQAENSEHICIPGRTYDISVGVHFFDGSFIGIGTGVDFKGLYMNFPVFLNYRYYIEDLETILYPFISLSAGYNYVLESDEYDSDCSGALGDISIGTDILLFDNVSMYLKAGINIQYQFGEIFAGPGFSVGMSF